MKKFFGYHVYLRSLAQLENAVEAVEKYMAPLGLNAMVFEVDDIFVFKNPDMTEKTLGDITPEALAKLCDRLRRAGVEPIPLYNCLGHQGWEHRNGMLQAHPELDETPGVPDETFHKGLPYYTPQWCPSNMDVYKYVFPAIDELIEVTGCTTFHLGMDEVFLFGMCDKCKGKSPAKLFGDTVKTLYDHIKAKNVGVMLWGDRLLNATKLLGEAGAKRQYDYETIGVSACIEDLPRDLIVCDWHYDAEKSYPSVGELLSHGYTTIPSCWYGTYAAVKFWEDALRQAKELGKVDLLPGMLVTDWGPHDVVACFTSSPGDIEDRHLLLGQTIRKVAQLMKEYFA